MAEKTQLSGKIKTLIDNVKYYWKKPPKGRYMSFKEIAAYAFGGIGAYLIVCMSIPCILVNKRVPFRNNWYRTYGYVHYVRYRRACRYSSYRSSC